MSGADEAPDLEANILRPLSTPCSRKGHLLPHRRKTKNASPTVSLRPDALARPFARLARRLWLATRLVARLAMRFALALRCPAIPPTMARLAAPLAMRLLPMSMRPLPMPMRPVLLRAPRLVTSGRPCRRCLRACARLD